MRHDGLRFVGHAVQASLPGFGTQSRSSFVKSSAAWLADLSVGWIASAVGLVDMEGPDDIGPVAQLVRAHP